MRYLHACFAHDGIDVAGGSADKALQRGIARRGRRCQQHACRFADNFFTKT